MKRPQYIKPLKLLFVMIGLKFRKDGKFDKRCKWYKNYKRAEKLTPIQRDLQARSIKMYEQVYKGHADMIIKGQTFYRQMSGTSWDSPIPEPKISNTSPEYLSKLKSTYDVWDNGHYRNPGEKSDAAYRLCNLNKVSYSDFTIYSNQQTNEIPKTK